MARAGPRKIARYGEQFKATTVKLSSLPGVLIQDVAAALDIHPFMLSLWRKPTEMLTLAREAGFKEVQHVSAATLAQRYFAGRTDGLRPPNNSEELLVATT